MTFPQVTALSVFSQVRGVGGHPLINYSETAGEAFGWRRS